MFTRAPLLSTLVDLPGREDYHLIKLGIPLLDDNKSEDYYDYFYSKAQ